MPRTEKHPHYVSKTRVDHKCCLCNGTIPKGSCQVRYKNTLAGKVWYHPDPDDCTPYIEAHRERMKRINHPEDYQS